MAENKLDAEYWQNRYQNNNIGWNIGSISTPIKAYIDQLQNKELKIFIPGCGFAFEAIYLHNLGFKNVFVLDFARAPLDQLLENCPSFPTSHCLQEDFFNHVGKYDLIIEQTMFCAIDPVLRPNYVIKAADLLRENGKLVGLLFDREFEGGPPFGGTSQEYKRLFQEHFSNIQLEKCYNSIPQRIGSELFVKFIKE